MLTDLIHAGIRTASRYIARGDSRREGLPRSRPEEFDVECPDVTLRCFRWPGEGPRVLLLHGLDANPWIWAPISDDLGRGRDLLAVSLRGHGRSSAPPEGYGLSTTTRDLRAVLGSVGWDSFHLLGHSWGGKIAMHLASKAHGTVRSLVLADPVPPAGFNPFLRAMPWLVEAVLKPERGPYRDGRALKVGVRRMVYLQRWDDLDRRLAFEGFLEQADGSFLHSLPDTAYREILDRTLQEDITARVGTIRCPALLLLPTFTVSFWPGEEAQWKQVLPQLILRRVPGDHSFIYTNPVDTARAIGSFLDGVVYGYSAL